MKGAIFAGATALVGVGLSAFAADPVPSTATAEALPCTLSGCVDEALRYAPEVRAKDAATDAARYASKAARGNYGPRLVVDGGVQVWNDEQVISFDLPATLPITLPPTVVREQVTWSVNVTIAQPLTQLWTISESNALAQLGVDVAELDREASLRTTALDTTSAWIQAGLAENVVDVTKASLGARQSDREKAGALVKGGVLVEADLARADLGVTQAKQSVSQAERGVSLGRARLSQLVGHPTQPERVKLEGTLRPLPVATLAEAQARASSDRLELKVVRTRIQQAETSVAVAKSKMLPEVNLVAQAQFSRPSALSEGEAAFVGVTFKWEAWAWGSTYYGIDQAEATLRQAKEAQTQVEDGLRLEVESAWIDYQKSVEQAELATEAVKVSQINYELVQKRLSAKAATTFDVVTAETDLTQAKINIEVAHANALLARARLARAMGLSAEDIAREGAP